jgi:multidrug efflux pump subunit AcrA (membrane-fusion protein)
VNIRIQWHIFGLLAVFAAVVVAAVIELGPPTSSTRTSTEVVTAAKGVIQSTVTGTGNVEPGTDVEANFQTSGTLQHLYVKEGDKVVKGQLLATLDPSSAQLTVDQAQESLTSAQDNLTNAEDQTATSSSGSSGSAADTSLENTSRESTDYVTFHPAALTTTHTTTTPTTTTPASTTPTTTTTTPTTPTTSTPTTSTPTGTTHGGGSSGSSGSTGSSGASGSGSGSGSRSGGGSGSSSGSGSGGASGSGQTSTTSAETIAANIASAQAAVDGADATLKNAENALHMTHLYAPAGGTVVNVSDVSAGDQISAGSSSSTGSSSSSTGSTASTASTGSTAGSLGGSTSSSSTSSSSGLVEIVNTHAMTMTVAFSESDISKIKVGQPANVTLEALSGVELAGHVSSISTLGTTSSSVVSYDATITIDQHDSSVKPGMSASAAVVTGQASGVNLPNSAITSTGSIGRVNLLQNGKVVPTTVTVGLVGDSRTQIVSGLKSGDQVRVTTTLPALGSGSSASTASSTGTLGGTSGLGGGAARFLGGGGGFAGGGGGFRGGG